MVSPSWHSRSRITPEIERPLLAHKSKSSLADLNSSSMISSSLRLHDHYIGDIRILAQKLAHALRQALIRFHNGVGGVTFGFAEQAHKGNVYAVFAQNIGDRRHHAGLILLHNDQRIVLAAEICQLPYHNQSPAA